MPSPKRVAIAKEAVRPVAQPARPARRVLVRKPRPKAAKPARAHSRWMTPTEKQKLWLAGGMLGLALLAGACLSGEWSWQPHGWRLQFRDLSGAPRVTIERSGPNWPRLGFYSANGERLWRSGEGSSSP